MIMKMLDRFRNFFKRQLSVDSPRRIIVTVALVAGSFWLARTLYHEWQIMRVVSVITQELQQIWQQPHRNTRQPVGEDDARA